MLTPGVKLRALREQLGFTIRDVEIASTKIAREQGSNRFAIMRSYLSCVETRDLLPSVHRFYSLAVIYRRNLNELLSWYGVPPNGAATESQVSLPRKSHVQVREHVETISLPVKIDPGFDPRRTVHLERVVEQWGIVPLTYLARLANGNYVYGYLGTEDFTMYPILLPGSFLQIDESKKVVVSGMWRSEYERPIYFVQTHEDYICSWCSLRGDQLTLQPHPLSPVSSRILSLRREAEVVGQVVGVAMRLGEWKPSTKVQGSVLTT
ncbi:MAG: hypothetical protein L0387_00895 [Acidobacteria bacterium]|nr:hypothetical protein [Acidobacteriota bacterium]